MFKHLKVHQKHVTGSPLKLFLEAFLEISGGLLRYLPFKECVVDI